jgi:hypothetical protein
MISLGFKRKDMNDGYLSCAPCCSDDPKKQSEYENEVVHPEFDLRGKHAEAMGFDDLQVGDEITVTLKLKVKGKRDDSKEREGKKERDMSLCLQILEADDYEKSESEEADGEGDEDESESEGGDSVMAAALRNLGGETD